MARLGSAAAARACSNPGIPPQSSGGHARAPSRQSGADNLADWAWTAVSLISWRQPSPKSYSYPMLSPGLIRKFFRRRFVSFWVGVLPSKSGLGRPT